MANPWRSQQRSNELCEQHAHDNSRPVSDFQRGWLDYFRFERVTPSEISQFALSEYDADCNGQFRFGAVDVRACSAGLELADPTVTCTN